MDRRAFLAGSVGLTGLTDAFAFSAPAVAAAQAAPVEYYELRAYHLRQGGPQPKRLDDFLRDAAMPAFKRLGIGPVGVFQVAVGPDSPTTYVLIPHASPASIVTLPTRLAADAAYQTAGAAFLGASPTDPAYVRLESSLLKAFTGLPKLTPPAAVATNGPRLFELRTYANPTDKTHTRKIAAFNDAEIAVFQRAGFQTVFFSEALIGSNLPNIVYLLAFEDMAARDKYWNAFRADPEFKKMAATVEFQEEVSNISNVILRPAPYSQI
jgi:hypothetical protein